MTEPAIAASADEEFDAVQWLAKQGAVTEAAIANGENGAGAQIRRDSRLAKLFYQGDRAARQVVLLDGLLVCLELICGSLLAGLFDCGDFQETDGQRTRRDRRVRAIQRNEQ